MLDLVAVREGGSVGDALAIAVRTAQHVESLGFKRYWLADRGEAYKLVALINHWRKQRNAAPLADDHAAVLCARSPVATDLPPAA